MRSFLSFLHFTGRTPATLASGVVCPAPRPRNPIPNTLSDPELRRFLKGFDRTQAIGKRDFAMALCLCRLGLRAKEVTSLQLEDVDWQAQTLHLRETKTRRSRLMPLPPDVAAAIQDYLGTGRPATDCSRVFVQHRAPYGAADRRSGFLRAAVRCACLRAGLDHPVRGRIEPMQFIPLVEETELLRDFTAAACLSKPSPTCLGIFPSTRRLVTRASIFRNCERRRCLGHDNAPETYHDLSRAGVPEPAARLGL